MHFFILSPGLLPILGPGTSDARALTSFIFAMGGKQRKIVYLCSLPGDPASTALINICSCREKEKPNFLCDACTTPPRFTTRNKSFIFKYCFFVLFFFSRPFLEIKVLSKKHFRKCSQILHGDSVLPPPTCPTSLGKLLISCQIPNHRYIILLL